MQARVIHVEQMSVTDRTAGQPETVGIEGAAVIWAWEVEKLTL